MPLDHELVSRLVELRLIETTLDPALAEYRRYVRATDRVIALARGTLALDLDVARVASLVAPNELAARAIEVPDDLLASFDRGAVIVATGAKGSGRRTLLTSVAGRRGVATLHIRGAELARRPDGLARQLAAIVRECQLFEAVPLVDDYDALIADDRERAEVVERAFLARLGTAALLVTGGGHPVRVGRTVVMYRVQTGDVARRAMTWRAALPGAGSEVVATAASAYTITPGAIVAAARGVMAKLTSGAEITLDNIHEAVRAHLDQQLDGLARRIECTQTWDDVVLPRDQFDQLLELAARVRQRRTVLEEWGFADKVGRGVGVAALFSGPPGTGKTMVAGLMARELGLDLYQVDLSKVVSKYIGETEKQLGAVFDAAESGHAIVLFDEADSLFAKRTEVRSSNDRYANLEVNYLLQRLEQFRGVAILTTNHERAIDDAFRRRLSVHVRFPAPDEEQRALLWRAILPSRAAIANDIDFGRLAQEFVMTGGYIKNAVLRAAFVAADQRSAIGMRHLVRGARAEYEALGKVV